MAAARFFKEDEAGRIASIIKKVLNIRRVVVEVEVQVQLHRLWRWGVCQRDGFVGALVVRCAVEGSHISLR